MENGIFSCLVQERKTRGKENGVENNPSGPTKYCLPNLGGKLKRKDDMGSKLHKYLYLYCSSGVRILV